MRKPIGLFSIAILICACRPTLAPQTKAAVGTDFTIAFGSCNKHDAPNVFWDDILAADPDVFIWGGDNVYADTDDMALLRETYALQKRVPGYATLIESIPVTGTWDDHDYGLNDGGTEFVAKQGSQREFLDFMGVGDDDPRRQRDGVYATMILRKEGASVKIINLDTRFFRTPLTTDERPNRRYRPNTYGSGTILGEAQWQWLADELHGSEADFNLIVSSVQFLSNEHGFEKWANHPHEVDRLIEMIKTSKAKGVIVLSGDRHISEFSSKDIGLTYPLIDFTSSGLTHAYRGFTSEPNPYRVGSVVSVPSFGLIELKTSERTAQFKIMGDGGKVIQQIKQAY
ncbi:MAG: alkaline phosphatase family protein [Flavobacteriaceae bacterium]|nr:alkaline phosphatase family protein [Flavobacteriaceae bacterium]